MGKKRIVTAEAEEKAKAPSSKATTPKTSSRKKLVHGVLHVEVSYNNTKLLLTDPDGNAVIWSTAGALGFNGTKKGTPFAAGKVAELVADKAVEAGLKEAAVIIKGVGPGRDAAVRSFGARGIVITSLSDATPVPFNGPRPPRPRRV